MSYIKFLKDEYSKIMKDGSYLFTGDEEAINLYNKSCTVADEKVITDLLPQPICGDIRNAKIIICSLNPGLGDGDTELEDVGKASAEGLPYLRERFLKQLNQYEPTNNFFWITEEAKKAKETSGYKYWTQKFNQNDPKASLVQAIKRGYAANGSTYTDEYIMNRLSKIVATMELFPYHSVKMTGKMQGELFGIPSVQGIREYLLNDIVPNLEKNNQLLCMMRSFKAWGLVPEKNTNKRIIFNSNPQNPTLSVEKEFGKKIFEHIKALTNNFTKIL